VSNGDWARNARAWVRWVGRDPHRQAFLDRALLGVLGRVRGERWLDAGCGEGRIARVLAVRGAEVLGVDIAAPLIAEARRRGRALAPAAARARLSFETADLAARGLLGKASLDGVVCALALMHAPRIEPALNAWSRALRPGGRLVLLLPHPCFMGPGTAWSASLPQIPRGAPRLEGLLVRDYPERGVQHFRFDPNFPAPTTNHHRSLAVLSAALQRASFLTARLVEPRPSAALVRRDSAWDPYARVPFFLLWEAVRAGA
jgi:SAM-dependent methyltransferase